MRVFTTTTFCKPTEVAISISYLAMSNRDKLDARLLEKIKLTP
jgi:hypothetical protein